MADGEGAASCGALLCFPLDVEPARREHLAALLSDEERARAARFHSPAHGARFIVAHGCLRQVLGEVLGMPPERIEFATGPHGKPMLADAAAAAAVRFNLSHSDDLAVVGWTRGRDIGVDIERWRAMRDEAALVRRFFSPAEIAAYEALTGAQRSEGFFNCWTRKEAYVKAVGRGLGLPLHSFDVTLESGSGARLLRSAAAFDEGRRWSIAAPVGPPRTSIAVVAEAAQLRLLD